MGEPWGGRLGQLRLSTMVIIDQYSPLDHYAGMGDNAADSDAFENLNTWVSDDDERRLKAYTILRALMNNVAREFVIPPEDQDEEVFRAAWREFGDPAVFIDRLAAGAMGTDPSVGVVGADDALPDHADLPDAPVEPEADGTVEAQGLQIAFQAEAQVYLENVQKAVEEWVEAAQRQPLLLERQKWIRKWAEDDNFLANLSDAETEHIIPLGECVWLIGWDADALRPTAEAFDPGFYFPELDDARPSKFPNRVHLAWQYPSVDANGDDVDYVRRMTWELVPLAAFADEDYDGELAEDEGDAVTYLREGQVQKWTCLFTDATYLADDFEDVYADDNPGPVYELYPDPRNPEGEKIEAFRMPMNLDFIPLVHDPNIGSSGDRHFGRSPLARNAQLLDELAGHDSDESLASQWAARPPVAASGLPPSVDVLDLNPGQAVGLRDGGRLHIVDMAKNLEHLMIRGANLLKRVAVNFKVTEGLVGRVDASEVPSGLALALSFSSFEQEVRKMRQTRYRKRRLILKMVQRIAIQNGDESLQGSVEVMPCEVRFGPFMPQDLSTLAQVLDLLNQADAVSQETMIAMLQEGGVPSGTVAAELAAIRSKMSLKAKEISEATGRPGDAADFLGLSWTEEDTERAIEAANPTTEVSNEDGTVQESDNESGSTEGTGTSNDREDS